MNQDISLSESYFIEKGNFKTIINKLPSYKDEFSGLLLCTKGTLTLNVENEIILIQENELVGFQPFISIKEVEVSDDCEATILGIHNNLSPFIADTIKTFEPIHILRLNHFSKVELNQNQIENLTNLIALFSQKLEDKKSVFKHQKINVVFNLILIEIIELFIQKKNHFNDLSRAKIITSEFINLLNSNINQQKGIEYFAKKLNITPKHLISSVKTITKETPRKIIDKMILNKAKKILIEKDSTIQEIAENLGFSDASSFTKFFKKNQGETPKNYRTNQIKLG